MNWYDKYLWVPADLERFDLNHLLIVMNSVDGKRLLFEGTLRVPHNSYGELEMSAIRKQLELLDCLFGGTVVEGSSHRYHYFDFDYHPGERNNVELVDNFYIRVVDKERFLSDLNLVLVEYAVWCVKNRYRYTKNLILPVPDNVELNYRWPGIYSLTTDFKRIY